MLVIIFLIILIIGLLSENEDVKNICVVAMLTIGFLSVLNTLFSLI